MSVFSKLAEVASAAASYAIGALVEAVRTLFEGDPETRRRVAFSVAMIALSAKMAKADGVVTPDEVTAFHDLFDIPPEEAGNVARLFRLAKRDTAGFETYAAGLAALCGAQGGDSPILEDILDGLFHIAKADGVLHEREQAFLVRIAELFGFSDERFAQILARHAWSTDEDPYAVLGLAANAPFEAVRQRYHKLIVETHPDRLIARGVPEEFLAIANDRAAAFNAAFAAIEKAHRAA